MSKDRLEGKKQEEPQKPEFPMLDSKPLDYWRAMDTKDRKKVLSSAEMPELTRRFFEDFANYYGVPEQIEPRKLNPDGTLRLCSAIVKGIVDDIIAYEASKILDGRYFDGTYVGHKIGVGAMAERKRAAEKARKDMQSEWIYMLTNGKADGIVREIPRVAKLTAYGWLSFDEYSTTLSVKSMTKRLQKVLEYCKLDEVCERMEMDKWELEEMIREHKDVEGYRKLLFTLCDIEDETMSVMAIKRGWNGYEDVKKPCDSVL